MKTYVCVIPIDKQKLNNKDTTFKELIAKCLREDLNSQEILYRNFYGYAMGICLRYSGDRFHARNILYAGFLKVFTNLHKYNPDIPFKAWLGRIMTNTAIDHYRSELKFLHSVGIEDVDAPMEEAFIDRKLNYEDLIKLVQQLPPAYRAVFNLFAVDGYTHDEIAAQLNISIGTSKSNLFKARKKLQELLKKTEMEAARTEHIKISYLNQAGT